MIDRVPEGKGKIHPLNEEFQRIARRDKKAFLRHQGRLDTRICTSLIKIRETQQPLPGAGLGLQVMAAVHTGPAFLICH